MSRWELPATCILYWALTLGAVGCISVGLILRSFTISQNIPVPKWRARHSPLHLLVVLGSGGHTAEMFSMLRRIQLDPSKYTHRTYIVSSGDNFSAAMAVEFETSFLGQSQKSSAANSMPTGSYTIATVPRARRVHQSYLTAPFSTLQSFLSCLLVLRGLHPDQQQRRKEVSSRLSSPYPDVILTNGPATGVCVIIAARLLRMYRHCLKGFCLFSLVPSDGDRPPQRGEFRLRTIFVESWARVTTLSLSGKLLLPFADRFLVQWPALEGKRAWRGMRKTEFVGTLMD